MITDINKLRYLTIIENIRNDMEYIVSCLLEIKANKKPNQQLIKRKIKSFWCEEYNILYVCNLDGIIIYSIFGEYVVIYPIEYILNQRGNKYIIFIQKHTIQRYGERFLHDESFNSIDKFLLSFSNKNNKIIITSKKVGVKSISIRINDGALLGYSYNADPMVIRVNTFISDNEIDKANREDQLLLRIPGK